MGHGITIHIQQTTSREKKSEWKSKKRLRIKIDKILIWKIMRNFFQFSIFCVYKA